MFSPCGPGPATKVFSVQEGFGDVVGLALRDCRKQPGDPISSLLSLHSGGTARYDASFCERIKRRLSRYRSQTIGYSLQRHERNLRTSVQPEVHTPEIPR